MRNIILSVVFSIVIINANAQEFNLKIKIEAPRLTIADEKVLQSLEREISEFYNERKWTNDSYEIDERIEGNIQINISEDLSANSFRASILISTVRPVHNSSYSTVLINHIDNNFTFTYEQNAPLRDNSIAFTDNLSSILTYYAYLILGFDYDSFSPSGGDKYFRIAQNIVGNIPASIARGGLGWSASESSRNKYWIVENLLNPKFKPYRKAFYEYHRKGLDIMANNALQGKANIKSALKTIDRVNRSFRNSMLLQMFSNCKNTEILDIYINSLKPEQREIYNIMSAIDPAKSKIIAELR
ncbi:MAG: DUF4835 family protein [Saprospiraceae bacterium]